MGILGAGDSYASNSSPLLAVEITGSEGLREGLDTDPPPTRVGIKCPHVCRQTYGMPNSVPTLKAMGRPEERRISRTENR